MQPKKLTDEDREKLLKDLKKTMESDIADTEAYIEDAAERLRAVFEEFKTMEPKKVVNDESLFRELKERFGSPYGWGEYFRGGMGAEAVRDLLEQIDLDNEREILEDQVKTAKGQKQQRAVKRLKVVSAFLKEDREGRRINSPDMMILEAVPVIPPELRPMVQLDGGRFATSDLNDLYRRVINRNNRLKRLLDLGAPEIIVNNEKRMLQEAVDALFDNGRRGRPVTGPGNRALKSLSDMLKGKQGRFRQNLLGKRVDYSGRSVIVSGPSLRLHQCGLPKLMALELFKPFIMARLVERKAVQNIKAAKKMVDSMIPEVWDVLEEVIHEHPVLLNRAPTLHRLGIQAFEPVLVEGKAIQVHPLVCHAFNADFDGDQMAVHLPLSAEAQAEARVLMLSANNILSPAHGAPLATPTQDMILGTYYLTYGDDAETLAAIDPEKHAERVHVFRSAQEAELAYEGKLVDLHAVAHYRPEWLEGGHIATTVGRIIFNDKIERALEETMGEDFDRSRYSFINKPLRKRDVTAFVDELVQQFGAPAISQVLDAFKDLGFKYATQAGITVSKNDVVVPPDKEKILAEYEKRVAEIQDQYDEGLITEEERHLAVTNQWNAATDEVGEAMIKNIAETDRLNSIFMMAESGARGSHKQIRQLAGMRGLMSNPKGEIIERPVKANFMEGLDVIEYFTSTHGARKGLADTALRTADSGYLTRRLVDVAQDVIIRIEDCGTPEHVELPVRKAGERNEMLVGRVAASDIKVKREVVVEKGAEIGLAEMARIDELLGETDGATVRGPLRAQVRGDLRRVPGVLRPLDGVGQARDDRRRGGHHRRPVDRRAGHPAHHADVPHRRRRRRGHHARPPAHRRAVRGAQAEGPGEDRHGGRRDRRRGLRPRAHRRHHRRRGRGAPRDVPAAHAPARRRGRARRGRRPDQRGQPLPARAALARRQDRAGAADADRAVPRRRGPEGLQVPGRGHQRQAHRADRAPDAQEGPRGPEGRHGVPARASSSTATSSGGRTSRSRTPAARPRRSRRSSSASPRPRWRRTRSSRRPPSRRRRRC